jgi:hypothetical protein
MLNINHNQIPKNDQELNQCVQAMNRAYGKYFNIQMGENRSIKLRDCYCESIGFTNGAYQQLQAFWQSNQYDFSNLELAKAIIFEFYGGYNFVIAGPIASQVTDYLCINFPNDSQGFFDHERLEKELESYSEVSSATWEQFGWDLLLHDSVHQDIVKKEQSDGNWFPLFYGQIIIGFAFSRKTQILMNGILLSCFADNGIDLKASRNSQNKEWNNYLDSVSLEQKPLSGKYIGLRMSSMESSVYLPFDEIILDGNKSIITIGKEEIEIEYKKDGNMFVFHDLEFDFLSIYHFDVDKTLNLSFGEVDLGGNYTFGSKEHAKIIEFAELFCFDRLEYRLLDEDDIDSCDHIEGTAFLIK